MSEIDSFTQNEGDGVEVPLFPHLRAQEEQRRMLDNLMMELASRVIEILARPASIPSPASTILVSAGKKHWLTETLLRWTGNAIIIDPDAMLWHQAIGKKVSQAGQPETTRSSIIRFALTEALAPHFPFNPFSESGRHTPEEPANFTEQVKVLTNDLSEKGKAAARLLLAVLVRYMEDTSEPSLRGVAEFIEVPSFYSGMQLISYLSNINDLERPGHRFSAKIADEFYLLENEKFVEEMFLHVRSTLKPFITQRLGDLPLADFFGSQKPTTLYVTCPRNDVERFGLFLHLLCTQFARGLRNVATHLPIFIAFAGINVVLVSTAGHLAEDWAAKGSDHLWSLQDFSLNGHPLQTPPPDILAQGTSGILAYLKTPQ